MENTNETKRNFTKLFVYRNEGGKAIQTNDGEKLVIAIRRGPKGLVTIVKGEGLKVLYADDIADDHIDDSEEDLLQKVIDILNEE